MLIGKRARAFGKNVLAAAVAATLAFGMMPGSALASVEDTARGGGQRL